MNEERFEQLNVPGSIHWLDAVVITDTIRKHTPFAVLELGAFMGLSTLVILDALAEYPFWHFTSVDKIPPGQCFNFDTVRKRSELVPEDAFLTHETSDALEYLQGLDPEIWDFIFEDTTHKTEYTASLIPEILRVLRPGGVALFHDVQLESMKKAFKLADMDQELELFEPSWMGMLRKDK